MPIKIPDNEAIFAIDPGNVESAYLILKGLTIGKFGKISNRLVRQVVRESGCEHVVIEQIASYGMPVGREVFETCLQIGRLIECADRSPVLITRLQVKLAICHSPKANDSTIRTALLDLFGLPGTKKTPGKTYGISGDMWAALALAETFRSGEYAAYELAENVLLP